MPSDTRALTGPARARAAAENVPYTAVRERTDADGETYAAAEVWVTGPANHAFCRTYG